MAVLGRTIIKMRKIVRESLRKLVFEFKKRRFPPADWGGLPQIIFCFYIHSKALNMSVWLVILLK